MEEIVEKIIETDFDELDNALNQVEYGKLIGLIVHFNGVKYEYLLDIKKGVNEFICQSSSIINKEKLERFHNRPLFHRFSWKFKQSRVLFNDPTRYVDVDDDFSKDLQGGWGVGTYDDYYLENIKDMVLIIAHHFGITDDNILFYGSSMGGFTSLMLGTMVKGSMVLADLPQLYLLNFGHFTYKVIGKLYSEYSEEELDKVKYRFSFLEMMKKQNYVPDAQIFISCRPFDIDTQYIQFISDLYDLFKLEDKDNKIKLFIRTIDNHQHMTKQDSIKYIDMRFEEKKLLNDTSYCNKVKRRNVYLNSVVKEKDLTLNYFYQLSLFNRIFKGFNSYVYIILKSLMSHESISQNLKLYDLLKNPALFDLGYYLSQKNLKGSKFYSYLNPSLHYIFFGINENIFPSRTLKFKCNDKEELLSFINEINK